LKLLSGMKPKTRTIAITATMTAVGIALGATIAGAASSSSPKVPALQSGRYVFACVNPEGGIDYLEFRQPLPHQCWFAGESLWYWDAVPLAVPTTPAPTSSPTPTPTPTSTPTPTPTLTPTPTGTATTTAPAT
jgi:hypothetical protein